MRYSLLAVLGGSAEFILIEKESKVVDKVDRSFITKNINEIENISIKDGKLIGTNGSLERYKVEKNNLVVLYRKENGFIFAEVNGKIYDLDEEKSMQIVNNRKSINGQGVSNGRIYNDYISAINGEYELYKLEGGIENEKNDKGRNKQISRGNRQESREQGNTDRLRGVSSRRNDVSSKREQGSSNKNNRRVQILDGLKDKGYKNNIEAPEFYNSIERAKESNKHGASVSAYSVDDYKNMNCVLFDSGKAGVAVKDDGDVVSVFKSEDSFLKGYMKDAMTAAVLNGGKKLDCYSINGALPKMYCKSGFIPVCKIKFNREFAPDDWDYERDGEPDIVFMRHCRDSIDEMEERRNEYKLFQDYTDDEVPYFYDEGDESAYELAERYRNNVIKEIEQNNNSNIDPMSLKLSSFFMKLLGKNKNKGK